MAGLLEREKITEQRELMQHERKPEQKPGLRILALSHSVIMRKIVIPSYSDMGNKI